MVPKRLPRSSMSSVRSASPERSLRHRAGPWRDRRAVASGRRVRAPLRTGRTGARGYRWRRPGARRCPRRPRRLDAPRRGARGVRSVRSRRCRTGSRGGGGTDGVVSGRGSRQQSRQRGCCARRCDDRPSVRGELHRRCRRRSCPRDPRALGRKPPRGSAPPRDAEAHHGAAARRGFGARSDRRRSGRVLRARTLGRRRRRTSRRARGGGGWRRLARGGESRRLREAAAQAPQRASESSRSSPACSVAQSAARAR